MSCVPTSLSKSKFIIASGSSPVLTSWLCAPYKLAAYVMFTALNLILNYPGLELTIAVYRGLPTGCSLLYVLYVPCVPVWSGNVARRYFWPIKAWDSWLSPLVLKVGNARKIPVSP